MGNFIKRAYVEVSSVENMSTNYIAKAFVKITNHETKEYLHSCLCEFRKFHLSDSSALTIVVTPKGFSYQGKKNVSQMKQKGDCININDFTTSEEDAVKLFVEVAKMQRFKDTNQWFKRITVGGIEYVKHSQELVDTIGVRAFKRDYLPLTPLELAEAVQQGKIKLN